MSNEQIPTLRESTIKNKRYKFSYKVQFLCLQSTLFSKKSIKDLWKRKFNSIFCRGCLFSFTQFKCKCSCTLPWCSCVLVFALLFCALDDKNKKKWENLWSCIEFRCSKLKAHFIWFSIWNHNRDTLGVLTYTMTTHSRRSWKLK